MERFTFLNETIRPEIEEFWIEEAKKSSRKDSFDSVIGFTAELYNCTTSDIGRSNNNLTTKSGYFIPLETFRKYFEPYQRQWVGTNRREQAELIAKDYIDHIQKIVEDMTLDGYTRKEIGELELKPRLNEINEQIDSLLNPRNYGDREGFKSVVVKSRSIVSGFIKNILKESKEINPKSFRDLFVENANYEKVITLLLEHGYLTLEPKSWTPPSNGHRTSQKYLSAFYFDLVEKGYLVRVPNNLAAELLTAEFISTSSKNLSKHKNNGDFTEIKEDYFFIPKC
ncbi:hypothetical protein M3P19_00830 [Muricauda sp. 2012CJ35-5]|uniref:Restriction endonuclease n=1 Tax=Flagellimonas spongiicola TaxID=2942208 RepID=A0ABT0PMF4_9FLAO|nr:hypothetical protein [Allomuricauda spongiicola]MCL6272529.1 hypothetical protein [Allomuricauda spongiicola]